MRRTLLTIIFLTTVVGALSGLLAAAEKILIVNVQDWQGRPKAGITIAPAGSGSQALTDVAGRGQIRLPDATEGGSIVTLRVVRPEDLRVVAPPRGRTPVPKFDGDSDSYVDVIVMPYADAAALESPTVLADLVARSLAQSSAGGRSQPPPKKPTQTPRGRSGARLFGANIELVSMRQQPAAPPAIAPLVTEEAARELGFTKQQVDEALAKITPNPLAWKAVLLTAEVEAGGRDPFGILLGDFGTGGVEFGIGFWNLRAGTLLPVLKRLREGDTERFDGIMGDDREAVIQWLNTSGPTSSAFVRERMLSPSDQRQVVEPWKTRFRALGAWPPFQRIQMQEMERRWVDQARRAAQRLDLRSERAFAFVYDAIIQQGTGVVSTARVQPEFAAFLQQVGRNPDEQEKLLLMANVASVRTATALLASVRQRRLAFALGEGRVYNRQINLLNAGFGMRDIETGAQLPLVNDQTILRRLRDGWLPSRGAATPTV
jgi:hypothetical protein